MQQHVVNVRQFIESLISNGQIKVARAVENDQGVGEK